MMRKGFFAPIVLLIGILAMVGVFYLARTLSKTKTGEFVGGVSEVPVKRIDQEMEFQEEDVPRVSIVAEGLDTPWAIAFLPEGGMLVTERVGRVRLISKDGKLQEEPVSIITSTKQVGEGGLHGITLHPEFTSNNYVYLYYTYSGSGGNTLNRVVRMSFRDNRLTDEHVIVDSIPGASNHDGGRIKFGPDNFLYITTGDAQQPSLAQDKNALAGKILRVTDEGLTATGNPFGNKTYTFGHRNPQGITWDKNGQLWSVEHGPSGFESGNDEFNKIEIGKNYGWPTIRGKEVSEGMVIPIIESGSSDTWAPAGLAFINSKFYFAGLRGQSLYEVDLVDDLPRLKTYLKNELGRLREVVAGPDGMLYVSTSNRDGRGIPKKGDDKIIRINPQKL